jgi:GT2 family glycosyltransferase
LERVLTLKPASEGLRALDAAEAWEASGSIAFTLEPGARSLPQGWTLFAARIARYMVDGFARLVAETDAGEHVFEIPISNTGTVFELVKLPRGVRRLVWQPSGLTGSFTHTPFVVRSIGPVERRWLMARRVHYQLWTQPAERKRRAGLGWLRPWFDLAGQYRACAKLRSAVSQISYAEWIERFDRLTESDRRRIGKRIARLARRVRFALVLVEGPGFEQTLRSVKAQLYTEFSRVRPGEPQPEDAYVCVLQAGDALAPHALYWMAEAIAAQEDVAFAYADEDTLREDGTRFDPRFKPDWSPEHLRSINYVGRWAVMRAKELSAAGGLREEDLAGDGHGLYLRLAGALHAAQVVHVPAVLYHRAARSPEAKPRPRVRHPLPQRRPLVSLIVPTRDNVELLRTCVESVAGKTTYAPYELIVVDNASVQPEAVEYLSRLQHRVLRYDAPFSFSAINNFAVREARGEVLVLLNNDTEVITPDWLEEMLGHLHQPGVGAVGAKLYYSNGRVQHAGDAVGPGGTADHMHLGIPREARGYCHRACVAHEVSAVTAACLMTWRALYIELGGLDAKSLPIAFNDVDYCLRLQGAGYRVVFTPHAELYHHESATRGKDRTLAQELRARREARAMRRRWAERMPHDPYYNPNLSALRPDFSLSDAPRVRRPWRNRSQ